MNSIISKRSVIIKTLVAAAAVIGAVALPQIFHLIGVISGTGAAVGAAMLPMHIPVLLAGFAAGPVAGLAAGVISPVLSFALTGMPTAALLPFMVLELGVYGVTAGILSRVKLNSFVKLLIVQVAGRAVRALATLAAVYIFGSTAFTAASAWQFITAGLFGILIQWALIPMLTEKLNKKHE